MGARLADHFVASKDDDHYFVYPGIVRASPLLCAGFAGKATI